MTHDQGLCLCFINSTTLLKCKTSLLVMKVICFHIVCFHMSLIMRKLDIGIGTEQLISIFVLLQG